MQRFVYTPRVYAFTKDRDNKIKDISPWIVRGEVRRVVNAVSSAGLTLRNPDMIFTTPDTNGVVPFMPMDPITIYLKRLKDRPVRVFTGFLDTTPYLQLFPGTVELKASCTLKRLQYTYFDPALPYTQSFLAAYGWLNKDGLVFNLDGLNDWKKEQDTSQEQGFQDSSIAQLLAATLHHIGHWSYDDIHIEKMPADIFKRMTSLYKEFSKDNDELLTDVEEVLKKVVGAGSQGNGDSTTDASSGGGSGASGEVRGMDKITQTIISLADKFGIDPAMSLATCAIESGFGKNMHRANANYWGWYQIDVTGSRYSPPETTEHLLDLGIACTYFSKAAKKELDANKSLKNDPLNWAMKTQGVNCTNNPLYCSTWNAQYANAQKLISQYGPSSTAAPSVGATIDDPTGSARIASVDATVRAASSSSKSANTTTYHNPEFIIDNVVLPIGSSHGAHTPSGADLTPENNTIANHQHSHLGSASDHAGPPDFKWAADMAIGPDTRGGGNEKGKQIGDAIAKDLAATFGVPWTGAGLQNGTHNGFRFQLIWQYEDPQAGNHYTHVHFGVKKLADNASFSGSASITAGAGAVEAKPVYNEGDSLAVGSAKKLKALLKKVTTDAEVGRHLAEGVDRLEKANNLPATLVVQLGTNDYTMDGPTLGGYVDRVLKLKGVKEVHWVNLAVLDSGGTIQTAATAFNTYLAGAAINNPKLKIVDWAAAVKSGDVKLGSDGIHPNSAGYDKRGTLIGDSVGLPAASTDAAGTGGGSGSNDDSGKAYANAAAFAATFNAPTLMEGLEAVGLTGEKSLLNDKPLLPFIQQLADASLRSFQSLPDGKFFGFYPDYFGEMLHHPPYWEIKNIEILDGRVDLSDDALVTHSYVVGDTTFPASNNDMINMLTTAGVISVNTVFQASGLVTSDKDNSSMIVQKDEAATFLERFGARPLVEDMPMIHSHFFEMFLAYQQFMLAWSRQFMTTFEFTFMPELFPGGKVGFPEHGLQMYIEDVTHSFDYESGFTTSANLSAPSVYGKDNPRDLPKNMIKAIINSAGQKAVSNAAPDKTNTDSLNPGE